eukprot:8842385-Heterocapsa_arctica.AAC.1
MDPDPHGNVRLKAIRRLQQEYAEQLGKDMPSNLKLPGPGQPDKRKTWMIRRVRTIFDGLPAAEQKARMDAAEQKASTLPNAGEQPASAFPSAREQPASALPNAEEQSAPEPSTARVAVLPRRERWRLKQALRASLDKAGGGNSAGLAALLASCLRPDERAALARLLHPELAPASWQGRVGAELVQTLASGPGKATLMGAFVQGCRRVGLRNRGVIKRHLK